MLVWLTELDLQLTNVEHFSESDVHHKIQQLNVRTHCNHTHQHKQRAPSCGKSHLSSFFFFMIKINDHVLVSFGCQHSYNFPIQSFQKEITLNTERIDGLIVFGEGLIQKSSPQDAALIEDELEELHSYCQEVFSRLVRFHQRLSQPPVSCIFTDL